MCQDLEQAKFNGERQKLQLIRKGRLEDGVEHPWGCILDQGQMILVTSC